MPIILTFHSSGGGEVIMRRLKKLVLILVLVFAGLIVFLQFFGGATIKQAVNTGGPMVLGVPVTLERAMLRPLQGRAHLGGLVVGNPEGFKTDSLFELGHIDVELNTGSLLGDTLRVRKIDIKDPKITMERGLTQSNLGALLEKLEQKGGGDKAAEPEAKEPAEPAKPGKRVIIDEISISGAQLNLSLTAMGGLAAPLPLPTITLRDLGKEKEGASFTEVLTEVVRAILGSATDVAVGAGKLVGDGAKAVGEGAAAVGGAAVDGAVVAGEMAVDGAKAVGGAAAAAGGAVLDGAGSVIKGVGSLLGGGEKKEE